MPKVIIYSLPTCPFCIRAKEFLEKNKVKFEDKDVGKDIAARKEMIKKSGQMGTPVFDIDGKIIIRYDIDALKKVLKIR